MLKVAETETNSITVLPFRGQNGRLELVVLETLRIAEGIAGTCQHYGGLNFEDLAWEHSLVAPVCHRVWWIFSKP